MAHEWESLYLQAIHELDPRKTPHPFVIARNAINKRLTEVRALAKRF
jgi:hypothetical protein